MSSIPPSLGDELPAAARSQTSIRLTAGMDLYPYLKSGTFVT